MGLPVSPCRSLAAGSRSRDSRRSRRRDDKLRNGDTDLTRAPILRGRRTDDDTFGEVAKAFIRIEGRKLRSAGQYQRLLDRLVVPVLGKHPVVAIKRSVIASMLDGIVETNGEASAKLVLAVVRRVLNWHAARSDDFTSPVVRGMGPKTDGDGSRERIFPTMSCGAFGPPAAAMSRLARISGSCF